MVSAIKRCQAVAALPQARIQNIEDTNYSLGIATLFLCSVDPQLYKPEVQKLLNALLANQQGGGGWGYLQGEEARHGDTSQTQYGVLASWTALRSGFKVDQRVFEKSLGWLMRTQFQLAF